jgi:hypothetical protein
MLEDRSCHGSLGIVVPHMCYLSSRGEEELIDMFGSFEGDGETITIRGYIEK